MAGVLVVEMDMDDAGTVRGLAVEPGDDDAFSPVIHRIISAAEVSTDDDL